jgi:mannose/cellobiose epimerase-like protein (N-acyl-D-glucosamine 2-epimerase family)
MPSSPPASAIPGYCGKMFMMTVGELRVTNIAHVVSVGDRLLAWFRDEALPLWDRVGVDRRAGGYFENIGFQDSNTPLEATGAVRRGRVVARQIYVFQVGRRLGWSSQWESPVDHGCDFLFEKLHRGAGRFHTAVEATSLEPQGRFDLYEYAFYLFALAHLHDAVADYPIEKTALQCLQHLRDTYGKACGGFEESQPPSSPLKSNPHMHLLEAALAWMEVTEGRAQQPWIDLAQELVGLCLTHFVDHSTGVIREYFDYEWASMPGDAGRIVEPGHQFEWAWLLTKWAALPHGRPEHRERCAAVARRLREIGERWGVDPIRGVAINEIWDDMTPKDTAAKLWPQTERLKAWCAALDGAESAADKSAVCHRVIAAAEGMAKYLRNDAPGLWHEVYLPDGDFAAGPSKASSLYHVACAIDVLHKSKLTHDQH